MVQANKVKVLIITSKAGYAPLEAMTNEVLATMPDNINLVDIKYADTAQYCSTMIITAKRPSIHDSENKKA